MIFTTFPEFGTMLKTTLADVGQHSHNVVAIWEFGQNTMLVQNPHNIVRMLSQHCQM